MNEPVQLLVIEHTDTDPLLRLGDWLVKAGATLDVRRPYAGDDLPTSLSGYAGVISLGGAMGALDDDIAPWLPQTRQILATGVSEKVPTLGICLGAQLLAAATGGTVTKGPDGPEIGAYLTAKRDAAESDPLFNALPMTPDVMHYHYDVVSTLPPGAVLLLSSTGYPHQAFRVGPAAWGIQFHIEPTAAVLRSWATMEGWPHEGRLGPILDQAEDVMEEVWSEFAQRFVAVARGGIRPRMPLPIMATDDL